MPIQFQCTWCGKKINAGDAFAGKSAKCPGCGGVVQVPAATEPPPATTGGFGNFPAPNEPPQFGAPAPRAGRSALRRAASTTPKTSRPRRRRLRRARETSVALARLAAR